MAAASCAMHVGECPICNEKGAKLTDHHVVEAPPSKDGVPKISLCESCHVMHEKYRNYLRDICHIEIDRTRRPRPP